MAYEPHPLGNGLGIHAPKIEVIREQRGLDAKGFRRDGTDPAKGDKIELGWAMYRRADPRLPRAIGGPVPSTENVNTSPNKDESED